MFPHLTHILLDAARMGGQMDEAKERNKKFDSLYRGGKEEKLFSVAPYIFQFSCPTPFSDWYIDNGWGDSWGVLFKCSWPLSEMYKHFRKFLLVNTEDGQQLYFRFYDPRVLRVFLPTCEPQQLREFFGPIDYFIVEDENPDYALRFRHENGILKTEKLKTADLIVRHAPFGAEEQISENTVATTPAFIAPSVPEPQNNPVIQKESGSNVEVAIESAKPKPKTKWNMFD